jgi:3-phenylpropionate/trans-cinnamate dioxygenase ferredoxin subunit
MHPTIYVPQLLSSKYYIMPEFVPVAKTSEIPDPGKLLVEVDDQLVVVFRVGDAYYCLDDVCTHDGGPLSEGAIDVAACTIACPRHGAQFALADGAAVTMPATKPTRAHEVKVEDERIFVKLRE